MKRIAVILLTLVLLLSCLWGCEEDGAEETVQKTDPTATTTDGDETGLLPEIPF
ncbi:MAG: hypothetical protein IJW62_02560 [Clostridia bacterium]|nr:hypothetical protein [Clostridia bacterium]